MELTDRAARRLRISTVGWLTTVSPAGRPQSSPVWFFWNGKDELLVYSLDDTARVRNLAANPNVAFNLDGDAHGGDIVTLEGTAAIDREHEPADANSVYLDKYRGYLSAYGWTAEWFAGRYSVPIVITVQRIRTQ